MTPPTSASNRRDLVDRKVAWLLFAFFFFLYLASAKGLLEHGDDVSMYQVTVAMVDRGQLSVPEATPGSRLSKDGRRYSKYGIGQSLLAVPLYVAGLALERLSPSQPAIRGDEGLLRASLPIFVTGLLGTLCTAATVALLFLVCRLLACSRRASLAAALALGAGTFAWHYARTFMSEPASMLALLATFYVLLRAQSGVRAWLLASGALAGLAVLVRGANLVAVAPLGLWVLWDAWRAEGRLRPVLKKVSVWAGPVCAALIGVGVYNYARFGSLGETGYSNEAREGFSSPLLVGLYGLLLSPGKSLFVYAPILLTCPRGWGILRRTHPGVFVVLAAIVTGQLLLHARWYMWWGGGTWGPRFLTIILPLLLVGLAVRLDQRVGRVQRVLLGAVALVSVLVQVVSVAVPYVPYEAKMEATPAGFARLLWNPADSPVLAHARSLLNHEFPLDFAWNLYGPWPVGAIEIAALLGCLVVGWRAVTLLRAKSRPS